MNLPTNYRVCCFITLVCLTSGVLAGCGNSDGLSRAPLTGKVTYHGQPLEYGMIGLMPIDGTKGPQAAGVISDGTYEIITAGKPGAVVGSHKMVVQCHEKLSEKEMNEMKAGKLLTPRRYATYDTTPLLVEVKPEGTVFDIELTDQ